MNKDLVEDRYGRYFQIPKILSEKGNEVSIICLDYHSHRYQKPELIKDGSLSIISLTTGKGLRWLGVLRYIFFIKKYLIEFNPDILVGASDAIQIIISAYLSKYAKVKLVVDLYDNYEAYPLTHYPFIKRSYKAALKRADGIIVITPELGKYINQIKPGGKIKIIGNAIDSDFCTKLTKSEARKKLKLPENGILIGTAGDLTREKGTDSLIKAFTEISQESENCYLILAGKADKNLIYEPGDKIRYLGKISHNTVPILFRALDVGVVSNLNDDFGKYCHPQKAVEMIASRLPFVAAKTGYLSRKLKNSPELLFIPGDYRSLKDAILFQMKNMQITSIPVKSWTQLTESLDRFFYTVMKD